MILNTRQWILSLLILATALIGCTPQKTEQPTASYKFIPGPPAPPRFQFLTSFSNAEQWKAQKQSSFSEWVVGADRKPDLDTRFHSPYGIAAENGTLYICDVAINCVHVIDMRNNRYSRLEAGGQIVNPVNLTIDSDGRRYLADSGAGKVLIFNAQDQLIDMLGDAENWAPIDVAILGDELFVADLRDKEVEVWSKAGQFRRKISEEGDGPDQLDNPTNLAFGPDRRLYVTDTGQQIVKVFDPISGAFLSTIGQPGASIGTFARPKGIVIDSDGVIYVADAQWDVVQIFNTQGQLLLTFGEPGDQPWSMGIPAGLAIDRTSLDVFSQYIAPNFQPDYLFFVVNQFGKRKVAVYAYGRSTDVGAGQYEIDMEKVERRREQLRRQNAEQDPSQ
jgi:hypothetical protein